MIYLITGMSLLFVAIGFIVTENNAKYLLSGYNTMREEDRKKVDIKAYIPFFRKFHIFLGISFFVLGLFFTYGINENAGGIFLGTYPIVAYIYFIWSGSKYSKGLSTKLNRIGVFVLLATLAFVIGLFVMGFKEDRITISAEAIEFAGSYGEIITPSEIRSIELVNHLPKITLKTNGFALGKINKGYFKTDTGEIVKLILNAHNKPYILFTKSDGEKIYFSAKEDRNGKIISELKATLPNIQYME